MTDIKSSDAAWKASKIVVLGCVSAERTRTAAVQLGHDAYGSPCGWARRPDYIIDTHSLLKTGRIT